MRLDSRCGAHLDVKVRVQEARAVCNTGLNSYPYCMPKRASICGLCMCYLTIFRIMRTGPLYFLADFVTQPWGSFLPLPNP